MLRALQTYCGTGRFILGGLNANGKCLEKIELLPPPRHPIRRSWRSGQKLLITPLLSGRVKTKENLRNSGRTAPRGSC